MTYWNTSQPHPSSLNWQKHSLHPTLPSPHSPCPSLSFPHTLPSPHSPFLSLSVPLTLPSPHSPFPSLSPALTSPLLHSPIVTLPSASIPLSSHLPFPSTFHHCSSPLPFPSLPSLSSLQMHLLFLNPLIFLSTFLIFSLSFFLSLSLSLSLYSLLGCLICIFPSPLPSLPFPSAPVSRPKGKPVPLPKPSCPAPLPQNPLSRPPASSLLPRPSLSLSLSYGAPGSLWGGQSVFRLLCPTLPYPTLTLSPSPHPCYLSPSPFSSP